MCGWRMSLWQSEEQLCGVVLHEVFAWLSGPQLARAGAACRAWRRAAAEPAHWRRLLQSRAGRAVPRPGPAGDAAAWRQEYVSACAGWRLLARHRASAALLHASLAPGGERLALGAADASVGVWGAGRARAAWRELARLELRRRGWSAVARVCWAPAAPAAPASRLLLAGPLALSADWELVVLHVQEDGQCGSISSRVRCSAGAAGCWADAVGDSFLSLELRRLGPGLFYTSVWLNAATQETQSEYTGVRAPLLRIYNEDSAHITHAAVASAPDEDEESSGPAYWRAVRPRASATAPGPRVLLAGGGRLLRAWPVAAPRPPPLQARAAGELAERVPCAPPARRPRTPAASARLSPDSSCMIGRLLASVAFGRYAVTAARRVCRCQCCRCCGACRARAPAPRPPRTTCSPPCRTRTWPGEGRAGAASALVQLSDWCGVRSPAGEYSPLVWWRSARSGAGSAAGAGLRHAAPAVGCLLPAARPRYLLVLAGDELYVWRSRATLQSGPFDVL
ncbi:uncharacterized protein LOC113501379 [Trichoplusia ni]|uniref:Uncharacterized protein LOC113501379 n=1 Tax=Trichoplusia ni TaxID=7111 RepID=A0A7E5WC56_TRINI|nr:uncharacterized protein LOC113501379 [Trichoplusia ni]